MKKSKKESYVAGVIKEGKRVRWPNRETMLKSLAVVLVVSIFTALWLTLDNYVVAKLLKALEDTFKTMG